MPYKDPEMNKLAKKKWAYKNRERYEKEYRNRKLTQDEINEFNSLINKKDTCWIWIGPKDHCQYGNFKWKKAHRISYELYKGLIPRGLIIRHSCDNPSCVNPEHLSIGTNYDNVQDRVKRGRNASGKKHGMSKLTEDQINEIKSKYKPWKYPASKLANEYNVGLNTIFYHINKD